MKRAVFKLLPMLDDLASRDIDILDTSPIDSGKSILAEFNPADTSTRQWQARRLALRWTPRGQNRDMSNAIHLAVNPRHYCIYYASARRGLLSEW